MDLTAGVGSIKARGSHRRRAAPDNLSPRTPGGVKSSGAEPDQDRPATRKPKNRVLNSRGGRRAPDHEHVCAGCGVATACTIAPDGGHEPANWQAAHLGCNVAKGRRASIGGVVGTRRRVA